MIKSKTENFVVCNHGRWMLVNLISNGSAQVWNQQTEIVELIIPLTSVADPDDF
jgi:hypothetical protein